MSWLRGALYGAVDTFSYAPSWKPGLIQKNHVYFVVGHDINLKINSLENLTQTVSWGVDRFLF